MKQLSIKSLSLCILLIWVGFPLHLAAGWSISSVEGKGEIITQERKLESFDEIEIDGFGDLLLIKGDQPSLTIETYENLLPLIESEVDDGELEIEFSKRLKAKKNPKFTIVYREIKELKVSGAMDIKTQGPIETEKLELSFSGASDAIIEIKVMELETNSSGASDLTLSGEADTHIIKITGAGDIHALNLKSRKVKASITGAGDIRLDVSEELKARITGAGDIYYRGDPVVDKRVLGAGEVTKL